MKKYLPVLISSIIGGIIGFFYWKFIGCQTGTCPIKANWYTMVPYGVFFGGFVGSFFIKK